MALRNRISCILGSAPSTTRYKVIVEPWLDSQAISDGNGLVVEKDEEQEQEEEKQE